MCYTNPTDGTYIAGTPETWPSQFKDFAAEERAMDLSKLSDLNVAEFRHRKWRAIHKHLHDKPFIINPNQPRTNQWRDVLKHTLASFEEQDVTDWLLAQIHIAQNLEAGIRDMRPRKNGPCYDVFMEFVRDRKRKYHVTRKWLMEAEAQGSALVWSVPPQMGRKSDAA